MLQCGLHWLHRTAGRAMALTAGGGGRREGVNHSTTKKIKAKTVELKELSVVVSI